MLRHILKKTLIALATIWIIITISFVLVHTMPGNPIVFLIGEEEYYYLMDNDPGYLEQLTDNEQTNALAYLLRLGLEETLDGKRTVQQTVRLLMDRLEKEGWEPFCSSYVPCGLAKPRIQELYACLNRFRG